MPGEHLAASGCRRTWLETTPGLSTGQGCRGPVPGEGSSGCRIALCSTH